MATDEIDAVLADFVAKLREIIKREIYEAFLAGAGEPVIKRGRPKGSKNTKAVKTPRKKRAKRRLKDETYESIGRLSALVGERSPA